MKSRDLFTTPVLIVSNYTVTPMPNGKYRHAFTPESTSKVYEFEGNVQPVLFSGERYNVGYYVEGTKNIVDLAGTARAGDVDPAVSYYVSVQLGKQNAVVNTKKSDDRVVLIAPVAGHYLGKKYAWRIYGMVVARDTFDEYLAAIGHPTVKCLTDGSPSIAYKNIGIDLAMQNFISSVVRKSANRFTSPLLPNRSWFTIKGLTAITDKK